MIWNGEKIGHFLSRIKVQSRGPCGDNLFLFSLLFNLRWAQLYVSLVFLTQRQKNGQLCQQCFCLFIFCSTLPLIAIDPYIPFQGAKRWSFKSMGEREWLLGIRERVREWIFPFPKVGNRKGMEKIHSQSSGTRREWKKTFPKFRNGKGTKKSIPKIQEREGNEKNIPKIHEREGNEENPFQYFRNGNKRPSFPGVPRNGNGNGKKNKIIWKILLGSFYLLNINCCKKCRGSQKYWKYGISHSTPIPVCEMANLGTGREWKNPLPQFRNGKGMKKFHSHDSGTGRELKDPFPLFGNGNQRLSFLGMDGNRNSCSPLETSWVVDIHVAVM